MRRDELSEWILREWEGILKKAKCTPPPPPLQNYFACFTPYKIRTCVICSIYPPLHSTDTKWCQHAGSVRASVNFDLEEKYNLWHVYLCVLHMFGGTSDIDTDCKFISDEISIRKSVCRDRSDGSFNYCWGEHLQQQRGGEKAGAGKWKANGFNGAPPPFQFPSHW